MRACVRMYIYIYFLTCLIVVLCFKYILFSREFIDDVSKVTMDDLLRVGKKYLSPLFDNKTSKLAVCCHPTKIQDISAGLKQYVLVLK